MQTTGYAPPADPTAVFGRRVVAFLIDLLIGVVIAIIAFALLAESQDFGSSFEAEQICDRINDSDGNHVCINADSTVILAEGSDIGTISLVLIVYALATQVVLPTITGGSLGKLMVGLRVVDRNTFAKAGFGKQLIRWVLWVADGIACGTPLVGGVVALSSKGHRRVGDLAAGTFVIDRKLVDHPQAVPGANDLPAMAITAPLYASDGAPPSAPPPPPGAAVPPPPPGAAPAPPLPTRTPAPPTPAPPSPEPAAEWSEPEPPRPPDDTGSTDTGSTDTGSTDTGSTDTGSTDTGEGSAEDAPADDGAGAAEDETTAFVAPGTDDAATADPPAPSAPPVAPTSPPAPQPAAQPGVDAPQWDAARDTYIQWDPELEQWMEWNEAGGRWIPISQ